MAAQVALGSVMEDLRVNRSEVKAPEAGQDGQIVNSLEVDMEHRGGLAQQHMGSPRRQHTARRMGLGSRAQCGPVAHLWDKAHRTGRLDLQLLSWAVEPRGVLAGTDEAAWVRKGCQLCCHRPMARRTAKVEERPGMLQALLRLRLAPYWEVDEASYLQGVEAQTASQAAYQAEASPDGTDSQAEEDMGDSRLAVGSTAVFERD